MSSPSCCCLCLSNLETNSKQGTSVKDPQNVLLILGSVFNISEYFIDSLSHSNKVPLYCLECTKSLELLNTAQSQEEGLKETVLELQKQLCVKLKDLAKVVGTIDTERSRVHGEILKSERQVQGAGRRKDELMTKEVQSLRQLIMGALMLSSEPKSNYPGPPGSSGVSGFPNNFIIPLSRSEESSTESQNSLRLLTIKVEGTVPTEDNHRSQLNNEEEWNEFVVLNEEAAEPIQPDELMFNEDDPLSDCGSEYTPPTKRRRTAGPSKGSKKTSNKSHTFELAFCSESSDGEGQSSTPKPSRNGDSKLSKQLDMISTTLKQHSSILDSLMTERQLEGSEDLAGSSKEPNKNQSKVLSILAQHAKDLMEIKAQVGGHDAGTSASETLAPLPAYSSATHDFSLLPNLPVDDKAALQGIEEWAAARAENKELLVAHLSLVGGKTIEKNTRRILDKIFGKRLRTRVNLTGKGGKIVFRNTQLHEILKESIRRQRPLAQENVITETASNWFRYSKFSLKPEEREKLKAENESVY